ncbi:copper amine oxidase N-terminal domain-containing protein [Paenibacillus sp. G2S3]|uniref:copper amine oxidase N-terminal domain-containing protein n=1 Tax=Paenibacillus sp. G2S3 TaxID=3047872 RepID=UPI0024C209BB|nr:copper amine oxidase N-terminal domain-containing protein [Paenibacillus sp. G2S3]WHY18434.1 copper amine oxidase N-terminal domain-containing protein [Paenibacillus sp. G2S3]
MSKATLPVIALSLIASIGLAPLTASAPISVSAAAVPSTTTKAANPTIKVQSMNVNMIFDGVSIGTPAGQYVFMYNNTTYVPLRFMSYALQKSVSWDAKNVKVTVAEPNSSEQVVIKEYLMNATNGNSASAVSKNLVLNQVKASYVFNGATKALPTGQSSFILNGSLYVPLRFLSESVGHNISWDQKTKTVTAASKAYQEQGGTNSSTGNNGKDPSPVATPAPTDSTGAVNGGSAGTGKVSYETITSETEAKLIALKGQSQSTLMSIALEYLGAKDEASKKSIKAKGVQQLSAFRASFNSIVADTEQKLNSNGYSTAIISQYRSEFEAQLNLGKEIAEGMAN